MRLCTTRRLAAVALLLALASSNFPAHAAPTRTATGPVAALAKAWAAWWGARFGEETRWIDPTSRPSSPNAARPAPGGRTDRFEKEGCQIDPIGRPICPGAAAPREGSRIDPHA